MAMSTWTGRIVLSPCCFASWDASRRMIRAFFDNPCGNGSPGLPLPYRRRVITSAVPGSTPRDRISMPASPLVSESASSKCADPT